MVAPRSRSLRRRRLAPAVAVVAQAPWTIEQGLDDIIGRLLGRGIPAPEIGQ
ncbi:MAG: hypothetical protein ACM3QU_13155 [Verrucomicrobiota bacterium]